MCCDSWGHKQSDMTATELNIRNISISVKNAIEYYFVIAVSVFVDDFG